MHLDCYNSCREDILLASGARVLCFGLGVHMRVVSGVGREHAILASGVTVIRARRLRVVVLPAGIARGVLDDSLARCWVI